MNAQDVAFLTGSAHSHLADKVVRHLDMTLTDVSVARFDDGKVRTKINRDVRGLDVYIIQPDGPDPYWEIENAYLINAAIRSAERVTLVNTYCSSARGDRRDEAGAPAEAAVAARRLAATHVHRVSFFDLHAPQVATVFEGAGIDHVDDLYARSVLLDRLMEVMEPGSCVTPPDFGRLKVVRSYWQRLNQAGVTAELGAVEKIGTSSKGVPTFKVFGDFKDRHVHMFDDIVVSAETLLGAARAILDCEAKDVTAWITHAVLPSTRNMDRRLEVCQNMVASPIKKFYFTDSLPLGRIERELFGDRLEIISISALLALVIRRLHEPRSGHRLSSLFELDGYRRGLSELTTT